MFIIPSVAAFILGVLTMYYYYHHLRNVKDEFFSMANEPPNKWRDTSWIPCPGSFVVLKHEKDGLEFGYVVGMRGQIVVAVLPKHLVPPTIDVEIRYIPLDCWQRWSYAGDYIQTVDKLIPIRDKYKISYPDIPQPEGITPSQEDIDDLINELNSKPNE